MEKAQDYIKTFVLFIVIIVFCLPFANAGDIDIKGNWQGKLILPGSELRIVFKINRDESRQYIATMDSPDQGATGIHVTGVIVKGNEVTLKVGSIRGIFKGTLQEDKGTIEGKWSQSGYEFQLNLKKVDSVSEVKRPQKPQKPFPYQEKEISFTNSQTGINLTGTLTLPNTKELHPVVILISGSGAQDRDETIFGHKPFFVLADYLTRIGFAVLRYDDRGIGGSTGNYSSSTIEDLKTDIVSAIDNLHHNEQINKDKIGLIGHSEGGIVASIVASENKQVAYVVLMAAPGVIGSEIIVDQVAALNRAHGISEEVVSQNVALQRQILDIVVKEKDNTLAAEKLIPLVPDKSQIKILLSQRYRYFLSFDPKVAIENIKCPVLAINGSKDIQVTAGKNLNAIAAALQRGGNKNITVQEIAATNHLFQTAITGLISEYGKIEETISPKVLKIIGDWLISIVGKTK